MHLHGHTNMKCFDEPLILTATLNNETTNFTIPGDRFDHSIMLLSEAFGSGEYVDLHLSTNQTFLPSECGLNNDTRTLSVGFYLPELNFHRFAQGFYPSEQNERKRWRWMGKHLVALMTGKRARPLFIW